MDALTFALVAFIAILLLGALAVGFGADSRDGANDERLDPALPIAGGAH